MAYILIGSDAGWWYIGADGKVHWHPGWEVENFKEFNAAVNVLNKAVQLKSPGSERVIQGAIEIIQKELSSTIKEGTTNTIIVTL